MEQLLMGHSGGETMYPLLSSVRDHDRFGVNADFASYCEVHDSVDVAFMSAQEWAHRSVRSISRVGVYSADQTALSFAGQIWNVEPERA